MLADELDVPYDEVTFDCAGVNHTAWFTTFQHGQTDLLPMIRRTMLERHVGAEAPGGRGPHASDYEGRNEKVRTDLMRLTGYFHTESSHHASEYWPWFRKTPETIISYIPTRWDFYAESAARSEHDWVEQILAEPLEPSIEYAALIIDSLVTGVSRTIYGNVRNGGVVSNLPHDACVEVACLADAVGVRPVHYGALPSACAALNAIQVNLHRLIVEAAFSGDADLVRTAVALDPLTGAVLTLPAIRELTDRMLDAETRWLPQFAPATATRHSTLQR
jgi:alpha-galactosidase